MTGDKVRIGAIGCGGISRWHLDFGYRELAERGFDDFTIAATCDVRKEVAEEYADVVAEFQGTRPEAFGSVEEMLAGVELDGVDICTPHSHHHTTAVPCLEAGVNVMVEKPIGVTVKATRMILDAAERNGVIATTAEQCRRELGQRAVRWALNEGDVIGEPRMFFAQSAGWFTDTARVTEWSQPYWRAEKEYSGGGVVLDKGAHMMDTVRYFFGDVERVYADVRQIEERFFDHPERGRIRSACEDTFVAVLTFKSGLVGTWSFTDSAPVHAFDSTLYYGSEGVIRDWGKLNTFHAFHTDDASIERLDGTKYTIAELRDMYLESLDADERERLFPYGLGPRFLRDGFALEIHDFITAIRDDRPPEIDGLTGLKAKATAIAIYESAESGEAVSVADVIDGKIDSYQREINERWGI